MKKFKKCPFCKEKITEYNFFQLDKNKFSLHHCCKFRKTNKLSVVVDVYAESFNELVEKWNKRK